MKEILLHLWEMKNIKKIAAIIAFLCSIIVGFIALYIPPPGVIHDSVLWWVAQLLCFTASILGITFDINNRFSHKHKTIGGEDDDKIKQNE